MMVELQKVNIKSTEKCDLSCMMPRDAAWFLTLVCAVNIFSVATYLRTYLDALEKAVRVSQKYLPSDLGGDHLATVKVHASSSCLNYIQTHTKEVSRVCPYHLLWKIIYIIVYVLCRL